MAGKLSGGTGAYAGISGSGKYQYSALGIGAKSGGKCSQSKPPVAWHQVINPGRVSAERVDLSAADDTLKAVALRCSHFTAARFGGRLTGNPA